jgi:hypothetical protein
VLAAQISSGLVFTTVCAYLLDTIGRTEDLMTTGVRQGIVE